jgi:DNA polymerase-3 subunit epsilon
MNGREIIFDTETTGLEPDDGHRVVEIGCVELIDGIPSGRSFHCWLNPERSMPRRASEIHGLTTKFLKDKPRFADIAEDFLAFIDGAPLVAHNAPFDLGFLNAELKRIGKAELSSCRMIDTLTMARRKHPGQSNRLDDLCERYGVDASRRTKHGALLDAEMLAEVYVKLTSKSIIVPTPVEPPSRVYYTPVKKVVVDAAPPPKRTSLSGFVWGLLALAALILLILAPTLGRAQGLYMLNGRATPSVIVVGGAGEIYPASAQETDRRFDDLYQVAVPGGEPAGTLYSAKLALVVCFAGAQMTPARQCG